MQSGADKTMNKADKISTVVVLILIAVGLVSRVGITQLMGLILRK